MARKKNEPKPEAPVTPEQMAEARTFLESEEPAERIATVWRAVLGLPKDFQIGGAQIAVCMSIANIVYGDVIAANKSA